MRIQTKHLFKILKVVKKTGVLDKIKDFYAQAKSVKGDKKAQNSLQEELGMDIIISIISGLDNAEEDIYDLLADVEGKKVKEIKEQDPNLTIESIKGIVQSDVFKGFLSSVTK